jgi:CBS domain-containing protein
MEQNMTEASARRAAQPPPGQATIAGLMRPPLTTVEQADHAAAAAYLMKHAGTTALVVLNPQTGQPAGIITEADIAHAVADRKDLNNVRIQDLMTADPATINTTASVRDAAIIMTRGHFRHLPVTSGSGLVGMVDITDICRALIGPAPFDEKET